MFIVITGGDKCGKSTQCNLLVKKYREMGHEIRE
jgi:thymidylate kinase